jgi:hypothetical protein
MEYMHNKRLTSLNDRLVSIHKYYLHCVSRLKTSDDPHSRVFFPFHICEYSLDCEISGLLINRLHEFSSTSYMLLQYSPCGKLYALTSSCNFSLNYLSLCLYVCCQGIIPQSRSSGYLCWSLASRNFYLSHVFSHYVSAWSPMSFCGLNPQLSQMVMER